MRHGLLLIREFETETDRALRLILDASASMGFRSADAPAAKYAYAALLAAALARVALARGDRVSLDFIGGEQAVGLPSIGGREAFDRVVGHLETARPKGVTARTELETALAPTVRYARRGTAVVVLSDLVDLPDGAPELVAGLSAAGRSVIVVQVLDPVELTFPFQGPIALAALEGDTRVETEAAAARSAYLEALEALTTTWESAVVARGGKLVRAGTHGDPVEAVRRVLDALSRARDGERRHR